MVYIDPWFILNLPTLSEFYTSRLRKNDFTGKRRQIQIESYLNIFQSTPNLTLILHLNRNLQNLTWFILRLSPYFFASYLVEISLSKTQTERHGKTSRFVSKDKLRMDFTLWWYNNCRSIQRWEYKSFDIAFCRDQGSFWLGTRKLNSC